MNNDVNSLKYVEKQNGKTINLEFRKICPSSSGTINNQTEEKNGLSLVSFLQDKDIEKIKRIQKNIIDLNYNFISTKNLHVTFLGLFPSKETTMEYSNPYFEYLIKDVITDFFKRLLDKKIKLEFSLKFREIRPGTWHGNDHLPIPYASDGTVVAIGDDEVGENNEFITLANELVCNLKNKLPQIFKKDFDRKFPTIWSTIGYFHHNDFDINDRFIEVFSNWKKSNTTESFEPIEIKIKNLSLVKYQSRSLERYEKIVEI